MKKSERRQRRQDVRYAVLNQFVNSVKCSHAPAEKAPHRQVKWWLAQFCLDNNLHFSTEATFKGGGRADFIVMDWKIIFEVLSSEKIKNLDTKNYPLPVIPVPVTITEAQIDAMMQQLFITDGGVCEYYQKLMREEHGK